MNKSLINKTILIIGLMILLIGLSSSSATEINQSDFTDNIEIDDSLKDTTISKDSFKPSMKNDNIITIDDAKYSEYFDEDGYLLNNLETGSIIELTGTFSNRNFTIDQELTLQGNENTILYGTTITAEAPVIIRNLTINNQNKELENAIIIYSNNCIVENCNILDNTTHDVEEIYVLNNNNIIRNNTITVYGPSDEIDWHSSPDLASTLSIAIISSNNIIANNTINTYSSIKKHEHGTIESITIQGSHLNDIHAENNTIINNTIRTISDEYAFGINLGENIDGNKIINNTIYTQGKKFADGIQPFSSIDNFTVTGNKIISISDDLADGIVISKDKMQGTTQNNTIKDNIIEITGKTTNGIEIYNSENGIIENNNIIINGNTSNGIIVEGSANLKNNTIIINSENGTGILSTSLENSNITNNTIKTNSTYAISLTNANNNNISDNNVNSQNNDYIYISGENNIIENNYPHILKTNITIIPFSSIIQSYANTTIKVIDQNNNTVNSGKVIIKINGITLKDNDGKTIYARVKNGTALFNYKIPTVNINSYISAVYSGNDKYLSSRTDNIQMNLTLPSDEIRISIDENPKKGQNTILTATLVSNNDNKLNEGYVLFKINDITLKDTYNKTLLVNVYNNTAVLNYTLPVLNTNNYNITAVYINQNYRLENSSIIEVSKIKSNITIINLETDKNAKKTVINATLTDEYQQPIKANTKVVIKINGLSIDSFKISDGIINRIVNFSNIKNLSIITGETKQYTSCKLYIER